MTLPHGRRRPLTRRGAAFNSASGFLVFPTTTTVACACAATVAFASRPAETYVILVFLVAYSASVGVVAGLLTGVQKLLFRRPVSVPVAACIGAGYGIAASAVLVQAALRHSMTRFGSFYAYDFAVVALAFGVPCGALSGALVVLNCRVQRRLLAESLAGRADRPEPTDGVPLLAASARGAP